MVFLGEVVFEVFAAGEIHEVNIHPDGIEVVVHYMLHVPVAKSKNVWSNQVLFLVDVAVLAVALINIPLLLKLEFLVFLVVFLTQIGCLSRHFT